MTHIKSQLAFLLPLLAGAALLSPVAARADDQYLVTVDTTSLAGTAGYMDLQFVGGPIPSTLTVTNFLTDGLLLPAAPLDSTTGGVTGTLPGALAFTNATNYNDYFEGLTYGTTVSFDVDLGGATLTPPVGALGSNFGFSLYDSTGSTPLLTSDPGGTVADIGTDSTGAPIVTAQPSASGGSSVATITPLTPAPSVPEPGSLALLALGLVPVGLLARRKAA